MIMLSHADSGGLHGGIRQALDSSRPRQATASYHTANRDEHKRTSPMKHLRDRVNVPRTAELELAEEAARRAVEKIFGGASGPSSYFKGVSVPLPDQQTTASKTRARRRTAHP